MIELFQFYFLLMQVNFSSLKNQSIISNVCNHFIICFGLEPAEKFSIKPSSNLSAVSFHPENTERTQSSNVKSTWAANQIGYAIKHWFGQSKDGAQFINGAAKAGGWITSPVDRRNARRWAAPGNRSSDSGSTGVVKTGTTRRKHQYLWRNRWAFTILHLIWHDCNE